MTRMLRQYLEHQADELERVLLNHRAPARVTGGTIGPRLIRFTLDLAPQVRMAAITALADDLALALKVTSVRFEKTAQGLIIEIPNPEPRPVTFMGLWADLQPLPAATALLGSTDDGAPLLARLASPDVAHVLISGTTGSGKTVLLRTIAVSLALGQAPTEVRLMCFDPKGRAFRALTDAPHLLRQMIVEPLEVREALRSLTRLMEVRDRQGEHSPRIVVLVDELADLVMTGDGIEALLTRLVQRGREAGIHLVAATQRPSAAVLSGLMRANFPLRLVGRVVTAEDARIATGRGQSGAENLNGRGDFIAVGGGTAALRFQVAFISEQDARMELSKTSSAEVAPPMLHLPDGSEDDVVVATQAQAADDARRLMEIETVTGTPFRSNRQREIALCGYAGGAATTRVEQALAWMAAQATPSGDSATTTTKNSLSLPTFFHKTGAAA
ncbi:MAG: DNA translocase FtsK [Anaerolineae bacterium]|nr:DNA translocase FtsK [Anaerolineae bacterium]